MASLNSLKNKSNLIVLTYIEHIGLND